MLIKFLLQQTAASYGVALFLFMVATIVNTGCSHSPRAPNPERIPYTQKSLASPNDFPENSTVDEKITTRELSGDSTLEEYRLFAAEHNPRLRALYHEWLAQVERAPQVRSLPEPRFGYSEYLREVETRTGPQDRKFSLTQTFPWFGKLRLRGFVEEEAAKAAWQRFLAAQVAVDHLLRITYAEYYFLGKSIIITRENLELLQRLESVARGKLAAGGENHPDIIRLQVEIGRLEDRLNAFIDMKNPLNSKLNALLNQPAKTEIPWPEIAKPQSFQIEDAALLQFAERNNPELSALQHEIERQALNMELAGQDYYPDFSLGFETILTGGARASNTRGSGEDPWALTFSVDIPLWYSKYRAREREAKEKWRAAKLYHEDKKNHIMSDLQLALYNRRDAKRKISLYQNTLIPKSQESLTSTEAAFRADTANFLDLIDSERVFLEFQLARERALANKLRADAQIDQLLGRFEISPSGRKEEQK